MDSLAFHNMLQVTSSLLLGEEDEPLPPAKEQQPLPDKMSPEEMLAMCRTYDDEINAKSSMNTTWKVEYQADQIDFKMLRSHNSSCFVKSTVKGIKGFHESYLNGTMRSIMELVDLEVTEPPVEKEGPNSSTLHPPEHLVPRRSYRSIRSISCDFDDFQEAPPMISCNRMRAEDSNAKMCYVEARTAPTDPRLRTISAAYKHFQIKSLPIIIVLQDAVKQSTELYEFFVRPDDLQGKRDHFLANLGLKKAASSSKKKKKKNESEQQISVNPEEEIEYYQWFHDVVFEQFEVSLTLHYWVNFNDFTILIDRYAARDEICTWRKFAENFKSHCQSQILRYRNLVGRANQDSLPQVRELSNMHRNIINNISRSGNLDHRLRKALLEFYMDQPSIDLPMIRRSDQYANDQTIDDLARFLLLGGEMTFTTRMEKLSSGFNELGEWRNEKGMVGMYKIYWTSQGPKKGPKSRPFHIQSNYFTTSIPEYCQAKMELFLEESVFAGTEDVDIFRLVHTNIVCELGEFFQERQLAAELTIEHYWNGQSIGLYVSLLEAFSFDVLKQCFRFLEHSCEHKTWKKEFKTLIRTKTFNFKFNESDDEFHTGDDDLQQFEERAGSTQTTSRSRG